MRTFKYSDRSWIIVDTPCSFQSSDYNGRRGDEIVCKSIVEISLWSSVQVPRLPEAAAFQSTPNAYLKLKHVLDTVELLLVSMQNQRQPPLG
jgi:hypothetical protein